MIVLDTPGGLDESMRKIVQAELASKIPVSSTSRPTAPAQPQPASGSAQAADVLAMAPQTNIGSSTPIWVSGQDIQKDLRRKVVNDAAASLRGAREDTRPQRAVGRRGSAKASNLTAAEALNMDVIDAVAPDAARAARPRSTATKTTPKGTCSNSAGAEVDDVEHLASGTGSSTR